MTATTTPWLPRSATSYRIGLAIPFAVLILYSLVPIAFIRPEIVEGFEGAVTNHINDLVGHGATAIAPYFFENRPGEYLLYEALARLSGLDALLLGQIVGALSYVVSAVASTFLGMRIGGASRWASFFAFLLLFDFAASAAIVSSSNIAAALLLGGFALLVTGRVWAWFPAALALAFAAFVRLDSIVMLAFVPPVLVLARGWRSAILPSVLGVGVGVAAIFLLYGLCGLNPIAVILTPTQPKPHWNDAFVVLRELCRMALPYPLPFALIGVMFLPRGEPVLRRTARLVMIFGPFLIFAAAYRHQPETPRFFLVASALLAAGAAPCWDALERFMRARRANAIGAGMVILLALAACALLRIPYQPWDGFRYSIATFLSPMTLTIEKRYGAQVADKLDDAVVRDFVDGRVIIVTSWPTYQMAVRRILAAGGHATERLTVGADRQAIRIRLGAKSGIIAIIGANGDGDKRGIEATVDGLLRRGHAIQLLTEFPDFAEDVAQAHPGATYGKLSWFKFMYHKSIYGVTIGAPVSPAA